MKSGVDRPPVRRSAAVRVAEAWLEVLEQSSESRKASKTSAHQHICARRSSQGLHDTAGMVAAGWACLSLMVDVAFRRLRDPPTSLALDRLSLVTFGPG